MARFVLDSNLIARALISPNRLAAEILFPVLTEDHLLCSSNFMLAELDRILRYPRLRKVHGLTDEQILEFVASIQLSSFVVDVDFTTVRRISRDINDDPIIETAIQATIQFAAKLALSRWQAIASCRQLRKTSCR